MPAAPASSPLQDLARAHGVATEYRAFDGTQVTVPPQTLKAVLAALDVDASTPGRAREELARHRLAPWRKVLPPVVVVREGDAAQVPVHVPPGQRPEVVVVTEEGEEVELAVPDEPAASQRVDETDVVRYLVDLPADLPLGYHLLEVSHGDHEDAGCTVVVTPQRLELPEGLRSTRAWGLTTQLYSLRSERSWGLGDAADLAELGTWAARQGADFVLVNPVHAAEPVPPMEPSPYLPASRRFLNPLYLRIEEVPEMGYLSTAERQMIEWHGDDARRLTRFAHLDRDAAWEAKEAALRILYRQERTDRRHRDYEEFCRREGQGLTDFATWCALAVEHGLPWTDWPQALQDPRSEETAAERARLADEVDFHRWLQWLVHRQLGDAQRELTAAGMSIGVLHDLAVGVHHGGADAWALGDVLARGVDVGAPPDDYNARGQNWSQPPWRPDRLAEQAYRPYRDMLRGLLALSGGLRVDHVLGLFRLWWVPQGLEATQGTYVRYDHDAMIGILALEAHRSGGLVIGEDLGTVEDGVREDLAGRGVLGTSILWFEREEDGGPRPPESYRELCLASVTTHDLPPTAGYLQGEHVVVRDRLGLLPVPLAEAMETDTRRREAVLAELRRRGLLEEDAGIEDQVAALHRFLATGPARLIGVAVPDLVGDERTINQPGTDEEYPNWRLPLAGPDREPLMLEDVMSSRRAKRLIRVMAGAGQE